MKREIRRPHWKQIAKRAKRKIVELKKELYEKQPAQTLMNRAGEDPNEIKGREPTKAQQRWYSEGFETAQKSYRQMLDSARAENQRFAERNEQRALRREMLKPALDLIQKLMED